MAEILFESIDLLYEAMMKGDSACAIALNAEVVKVQSEEGDFHPESEIGVVKGSIYINKKEAYLVCFNGEDHLTFVTGEKIHKR